VGGDLCSLVKNIPDYSETHHIIVATGYKQMWLSPGQLNHKNVNSPKIHKNYMPDELRSESI